MPIAGLEPMAGALPPLAPKRAEEVELFPGERGRGAQWVGTQWMVADWGPLWGLEWAVGDAWGAS